MKVLGIETSTHFCGVAILDETRLIGEYRVVLKLKHAERLLPLIDMLLKESETRLSDLSAIAVSIGPGSFTGLRAGVATAKGLAIGSHLPLIAISTLEAMAAVFSHCELTIVSVIPSRKDEVYWAAFSASEGIIARMTSDACDLVEIMLEKLSLHRRILFTGEGAILFRDQIAKKMKGSAIFPEISLQAPFASLVAERGRLQWMRGTSAAGGEQTLADEIIPVYLHEMKPKTVK
ncbi:MAG: tRNA (adenosine(37)-N6)-threonylcarbamoyltransferase complex dimerization subunit type 1 TsaB [Nitrospirota bacterium]